MHTWIILIAFLLFVSVPAYVIAQSDAKVAVIETKSGNFVIELYPEIAPNHVDNFIKLAEQGYYDGTIFHRVIKDFMIQGGDPNTKDPEKINLWGTGGPGYSIDAEFNDMTHERGIVSMARSQNPNSAGSQFFIVHDDATFLDGQYTVFGGIIGDESFLTLDKIANMETVPGDRPVKWQNTEIISITFVDNNMITTKENSKPNVDSNDDEVEGGCLIATAAFGSELAPQIQHLRELRDTTVLETESGKAFLSWFNSAYYTFSPIVADLERENKVVKKSIQIAIVPMIASLSILEILPIYSEAEMMAYGSLVILVNILMYVIVPVTVFCIMRKYLLHMRQSKNIEI